MADLRVSRVVAEGTAAEGEVAGVTKVDVQTAGDARGATAQRLLVSRIVVEGLAEEAGFPQVTKVDVQTAGDATQASTVARLGVSMVVVEGLATEPGFPQVTKVDVQTAGDARAATSQHLRFSRIVLEGLAPQSLIGKVVPLPLSDDSQIFLHNWVSQATLNTSYRTDVRRSPKSGAESRRGIVEKPYRTQRVEWWAGGDDPADISRLDRLEVFLRRMGDEPFQVPLYMDQIELSASLSSAATQIPFDTTKGRWFEGARVVVVVVGPDGEISHSSFHEILSVHPEHLNLADPIGTDIPAGALVMPVIDCEVDFDVARDMVSARVHRLAIQVDEVEGPSALPPLRSDTPPEFTEFAGKAIFHINPDWVEPVRKGRVRQGSKTESGRGTSVFKAASRSRSFHEYAVSGQRNDIWPVVKFFDSRRGRLRSFWHVDLEQIWKVVGLDPSGNFINVMEEGDFSDFQEEFSHVGLEMADGTVYVREVVTIQDVLSVWRLTVTPVLPGGLVPDQVVRIARARTTCFDSDELEEVWQHTGLLLTKLTCIEALDEADYHV